MAGILTGADPISGSRFAYQEAKIIKNCYRGAAAPVDAVAGVLWQDSADDRLYQYDGAAWNLLGPDEVGTWTPAVTFGGAAVGMAYAADSQNGRYVRMDDWVSITGRILLTAKGTSVGNARIEDLPFTFKDDPASYAAINVQLNVISFADQWTAYIIRNTDYIGLSEMTMAGVHSYLDNTNFANTSSIMIGGTYEIKV